MLCLLTLLPTPYSLFPTLYGRCMQRPYSQGDVARMHEKWYN
nr:hypothetical protein [Okeania sp. SIO2F4]